MPLALPCPDADRSSPPALGPGARSVARRGYHYDIRSDAGLLDALRRLPSDGGWSGPTGQQLVSALTEHCARLAPAVERRVGQPRDPHRAADLTSRAWEILATRPHVIARAESPWAYLTTCVMNAGVNAAVADGLLVRDVAVQGGGLRAAVMPSRVGEHVDDLDRGHGSANTGSANSSVAAGWDHGLRALLADLVAAGAPAAVTGAAIERVVDLVAMNRRGHRESAAKKDRVLAGLGLSPQQANALLTLVAGTRRGGASESLWALRRSTGGNEVTLAPALTARIAAYVREFGEDLQLPA